MDNAIDQQRAIYGTSLAERFGFIMQSYGLSQRSLAQVLGLSAPMLSQLMGGRRIKIGNPAVYGRLLMLEARSGEVDRDTVLREVEQADAVTATQSSTDLRDGTEQQVVAEYLRANADQVVLRILAQRASELGAVALAQVLDQAAAVN